MNREASAPEESVSFGSSLVRITNRLGTRPVQGSRYFRSIMSVSSPEIESSRSTTILLSALPESRASEMNGALPATLRTHEQKDLLQPRAAAEDVPEQLL